MWVYYKNGRPEGTGLDLDNSGFEITVRDKNGEDITDWVTNSAQASGRHGDSLQFFVDTSDSEIDGETITVTVVGLGTFPFEVPPATSQTDPLESDIMEVDNN